MDQATNCTLSHGTRLTRNPNEHRVELDNVFIKNTLWPLAVSCKNYLFANSQDLARRAAAVYSLLVTSELHAANPQAWLTDVFERLPTHPAKHADSLLPHHWKRVRHAEKDTAA